MVQTYKQETTIKHGSIELTRVSKVNGLPPNSRNTYRVAARATGRNGKIFFDEDATKYITPNISRTNDCLSLRNNRTGKVIRTQAYRDKAEQIAFSVAHKARTNERQDKRAEWKAKRKSKGL